MPVFVALTSHEGCLYALTQYGAIYRIVIDRVTGEVTITTVVEIPAQ